MADGDPAEVEESEGVLEAEPTRWDRARPRNAFGKERAEKTLVKAELALFYLNTNANVHGDGAAISVERDTFAASRDLGRWV